MIARIVQKCKDRADQVIAGQVNTEAVGEGIQSLRAITYRSAIGMPSNPASRGTIRYLPGTNRTSHRLCTR